MPNTTTTFTRKGPGGEQTRVAHSAAEAVKLRFAGWTEVKPAKTAAVAEPATKPATTTTTTTPAK